MVVDRAESGPGASMSTEKVAPVSKRNQLIDPPTVIDTQGSSGVIRMVARVGTPGHLRSRLS